MTRRLRTARWMAVVREALATSWAQPVASVVTIVMVAGMCATVLLTTGRTVGAEQAVISSIDSAGTRSIIVRAETSREVGGDFHLFLTPRPGTIGLVLGDVSGKGMAAALTATGDSI